LILAEGDSLLYSGARNPAIDVTKIIHFAMAIYWKAAVYSWAGDTYEPQLKLGPYAEEIRRFLLGAPFPKHVALAAVLSPPACAYIGFNNPYEADRDSSYRNFMFCVPGIWFMLSVGKTIPQEIGAVYTSTRPENPIWVSGSIAAKGQETAFRVFKEARKTRAFGQAMEKVRAAGKTI
jgi:hypothetical protein